ncbi:MAG: YraN family protein [candidate division WOR-3 bacterium]
MRRVELGKKGETLARRYLVSKGYTIIDTNYRSKYGEIDIICEDGETVVFVEVKSRTSEVFGKPAESVNWQKQKRLHRLAEDYLIGHKLEFRPVRFDVLSLLFLPDNVEIEHIQGAF